MAEPITADILTPSAAQPDVDGNTLQLFSLIQKTAASLENLREAFLRSSQNINNTHRQTAVVIGKVTNPLDIAAFGPFCIQVIIPALGDTSNTVPRIARCQRNDTGRIVMPKAGALVNCWFDRAVQGQLYWNGVPPMNSPTFLAFSYLAEGLPAEALLLANVPTADIDIFESSGDFKFLLDKTIPALHQLKFEMSGALAQMLFKTGVGGTVAIGDGGNMNVDILVGPAGSLLMEAGAAGTIDILTGVGGSIWIESGGDLALFAGTAGGVITINSGIGANVNIAAGAGGFVSLGDVAVKSPVNNLPTCLFNGLPHYLNPALPPMVEA